MQAVFVSLLTYTFKAFFSSPIVMAPKNKIKNGISIFDIPLFYSKCCHNILHSLMLREMNVNNGLIAMFCSFNWRYWSEFFEPLVP